MREPLRLQNNIIFWHWAAEKNILGINPRNDNHPDPFPTRVFVVKGCCKRFLFFTNLRQAVRCLANLVEVCLSSHRSRNFQCFLSTCSRLNLLLFWELPRQVSSFVPSFLQNYFSGFIQDFRSSPRFLSLKPSFLYDHLTTQHSEFSLFLVNFLTDKLVDRSIHAYALT